MLIFEHKLREKNNVEHTTCAHKHTYTSVQQYSYVCEKSHSSCTAVLFQRTLHICDAWLLFALSLAVVAVISGCLNST